MDMSMQSLVVECDLKETFYRNAAGGILGELSVSAMAKIFWRKRRIILRNGMKQRTVK